VCSNVSQFSETVKDRSWRGWKTTLLFYKRNFEDHFLVTEKRIRLGLKVMSRTINIYWGWYVVLGAFVMLGVNYGSRYSFGVFVGSMFEDYGWSMSTISLAATANLIMYALGGVLWGRVIDRASPRWVITAGVIMSSLGFLGASTATSPMQLYLYYGVLCGFGGSCFGLVVCSSSVGKWFIRKQGVAVGIGTMGIGLGTLLLPALAGWMVKHYGWRPGFLTLGATLLVLGILVSQTLMRKSTPERHGLYPDGERGEQCRRAADDGNNEYISTSIQRIFRDSRFWVLTFCYSAGSFVSLMMFVHQVAYAANLGIDHVVAAASLGILGVSSIFGRFFYGWLCDRLRDPRHAGQVGFFVMAVGMAILICASSPTLFYFYAVIFGFGYGSLAPMPPILLAHRFGRKILGSAYGLLSFFLAGFGSIGPVMGGFIYDFTGSYDYAWIINCTLLVLGMTSLCFLKSNEQHAAARTGLSGRRPLF